MGIVVVLVEPSDDANIGAAARAMKNCGLGELRLVRRRAPGARARRLAVHAEDVLAAARRFPSLAEAVADAAVVAGFTGRRRRFGPPLGAFGASAALALRRRARRGSVALVFGREDAGLSDAEARLCTELWRLPASPARPVFNLSQAVLLAAHAIAYTEAPRERGRRARPARAEGEEPRADQRALDGILAEAARALAALRYPPAKRPHDRTARILARLRSQLSRAGLDADDVAMWRGLLARIR